MQTGTKKDGVPGHERAPHSKNGSRAHHVEVVLARIFAKQCGHTKQKSLRHADLESVGAEWH